MNNIRALNELKYNNFEKKMEKDSGRYRYEPYPTITKQNNGNTNSLKRDNNINNKSKDNTKPDKSCCTCFGRKKSRRRQFLKGLFTNFGICLLLFAYTLIGSFIFLAIEGGYNTSLHQFHQRTLAATSSATKSSGTTVKTKNMFNTTLTIQQLNNEAREKTVENIWDITVNLNILYRDNWTRLAAQEITRFQDQLIKRITDEMHQQYLGVGVGSGGGGQVNGVRTLQQNVSALNGYRQEYEWTFAKAFLYSLTVLTTIGKFNLGH